MTTLLKLHIYIIFCTISLTSYGQIKSVIGFREVTNVPIGDKNRTPIAKWTKINKDGSYQSGNGWLQSIEGSWNFNSKNHVFTSTDSLGLQDEYGGFNVSFVNEKMLWKREEDGMQVTVTLKPISKLPMSPADYLEGMWKLSEITENNVPSLNHPDYINKSKLLIRWDRVFVNYNTQGEKAYGYWHIHGHKSIVTFLFHQEDKKPERWKIQVNKDELIMIGISENNKGIQQKYMRKNTF